MSLKVVWTDEAQETFDNIVSFIESNWSAKPAQNFVRHTQRVLLLITENPYMYKASLINNLRQAVISPQTSMFYEVNASHILILFFWDNRQETIW